MSTPDVATEIKNYIAEEILDGEDVDDLDESTPLLELGILNSMELMSMVAHIQSTFGVEVPTEAIVPTNFKDIAAITAFVTGLQP